MLILQNVRVDIMFSSCVNSNCYRDHAIDFGRFSTTDQKLNEIYQEYVCKRDQFNALTRQEISLLEVCINNQNSWIIFKDLCLLGHYSIKLFCQRMTYSHLRVLNSELLFFDFLYKKMLISFDVTLVINDFFNLREQDFELLSHYDVLPSLRLHRAEMCDFFSKMERDKYRHSLDLKQKNYDMCRVEDPFASKKRLPLPQYSSIKDSFQNKENKLHKASNLLQSNATQDPFSMK